MSVNDLVLVQGMDDTKEALRRYRRDPRPVLVPWLTLSLAIAALLLMAVWLVAVISTPDIAPTPLNGVAFRPDLGDYLHIIYRNSLVLALHAMACVAGFMAGSSIPLSAANRSGVDRWVHEKAGPAAIAFVAAATIFSLSTQAYFIGSMASTIAGQLQISPGLLLVGLLPHALPELVALFLPLAAWLIASRQKRWEDLLAATAVCVVIAFPVLMATAAIELWVSPDVLRLLAGV